MIPSGRCLGIGVFLMVSALIAPLTVTAEMVVETFDGRVFNVPVKGEEIRLIRFTDATSSRHRYKVYNHEGNQKWPHVYEVDWSNCKIAEPDSKGGRRELVGVEIRQCKPNKVLIFRAISKDGYFVDYNLTFDRQGRTVQGTWRDSMGKSGKTTGQLAP